MKTLLEIFGRTTSQGKAREPGSVKYTGFFMPQSLYDVLGEIHRRSLDMAERLLEVMDDPEHEFFLQFGRNQSRKLPDMEALRIKILFYAEFLRDALPQNLDEVSRKPGFLYVPIQDALNLAHMLDYNNLVLKEIETQLKDTEYMKIFTDAKAVGLIYSGKCALAEIVNLSLATGIANSESPRASEPGRWPVATCRAAQAAKPPRLN